MFEKLLRYASDIAIKVNSIIDDIVKGDEKKLYNASLHLIKAGGKRLRPLLVVLSARLFGVNEEIAMYPAAAVEILHNFTLIHDDIMDRDDFRRGIPTVHKVYGEPMAILAGDLLFAKSYEALLRLSDYDIPSSRLIRALRELTWAAVTVAEGQALDMEFELRDDVTIDEYFKMIFKKTAALFKSSAYIGAVIAGANDDDVEKVSNFAKYVGMAFQIRDDELGLVGDEKVLGKPVYSDLREGKKTLPIIYALNNLSGSSRDFILSVLGNRSSSLNDLKRAADMIIASGALEYSNRVAEEFLAKGLEFIKDLKPIDAEALELLREYALFLTKRYY